MKNHLHRAGHPTRCATQHLLLATVAWLLLAIPASAQTDSPEALALAVDAPNLVWSTGGATNWFSQTNVSHDGVDAARSGALGNSQTSFLQTSVVGPGTLTFWWKVSSRDSYDYLRLYNNNVAMAAISGEVDWQQQTQYVGAGTHIYRWEYSKNIYTASGQDAAWLDEVSFTPGGTAPLIQTQPTPTTLSAGLTATLSVAAGGTPTLVYQWLLNGVPLQGGTNATLSVPDVQTTNAGNYQVLVGNTYGSVTSTVATLTVTPSLPVITSQPLSRSVALGQSIALGVGVRGTQPLSYQWLKSGTNLPGATSATLPLANFQTSDAALYSVTITNALGSVTSQSAILTVTQIFAWGGNSDGQTTVPVGLSNVVAVASGNYHNLALRADGTVAAWGYNNYASSGMFWGFFIGRDRGLTRRGGRICRS